MRIQEGKPRVISFSHQNEHTWVCRKRAVLIWLCVYRQLLPALWMLFLCPQKKTSKPEFTIYQLCVPLQEKDPVLSSTAMQSHCQLHSACQAWQQQNCKQLGPPTKTTECLTELLIFRQDKAGRGWAWKEKGKHREIPFSNTLSFTVKPLSQTEHAGQAACIKPDPPSTVFSISPGTCASYESGFLHLQAKPKPDCRPSVAWHNIVACWQILKSHRLVVLEVSFLSVSCCFSLRMWKLALWNQELM